MIPYQEKNKSHIDNMAATARLPSWNPVPSLRAELGARLPPGTEEGGDVNRSLSPQRTCRAGAWCSACCIRKVATVFSLRRDGPHKARSERHLCLIQI